jgi:thioredoxin reductase/bacterioferritin-associated ferredoxin
MSALPDSLDVAIIGAGPAGMAAAVILARSGAAVAVFDEGAAPGGQIYRDVGRSPLDAGAVLGADYWQGRGAVDAFAASGVPCFHRSTVWAVQPGADGHEVALSREGKAYALLARRVLIATGAIERPFPIPGWTLPGVLGAGAAQVALKSAALGPDGQTVLAGTGPLLYLLAQQLLAAGVPIAVLLDMTPPANRGGALRALPGFALSSYLRKGLALRAAVRRGVRIERAMALQALGENRLQRVVWTDRAGRQHEMTADWLLLHQGVAPNLNLARATGCALDWDAERLAFRPRTDRWGESAVPGVFVAGDGAGIVGATAAAVQGRLAALQIAAQLGGMKEGVRDAAAMMLRRQLRAALRGRRFLDRYFRPADACRIPTGDTIVCRCEEVTADQVRDAIAQGAVGPNQAKAYLRCGMGPCQGRYCGLTLTEMIAARTAKTPQQIGYFRLRAPVKPVTLGELASLPANQAAQRVVDPA